jgi:hypothetical protein
VITRSSAWLTNGQGPLPDARMWERTLSALGGFIAWLAFASAGMSPRIYDAADYWNLAAHLLDGSSNVELFRGYASGLVYLPAVMLSRAAGLPPELAILLQAAAMLAILGWFVLPLLASAVLNRHTRILDRFATTGLLWLLWGGFASVALVDVAALLLLLAAALLAWHTGRWWPALIAGTLVGLACNVRPGFFLGALAVVVMVMAAGSLPRPARFARVVLIVLGLAFALAPQAAVNRASTAAMMPPVPPETSGLMAYQLGSGLIFSRYATSIDPLWPSSQVWSCDLAGADMIARSQQPTPADLGAYVGLLASDPRSAAGLLTRHAAALAWLDGRTPYVSDVSARPAAFGFINVLLVVMLTCFVASQRSPRIAAVVGLAIFACAPALLAVPETRLALPLSAVAIAFCAPAIAWTRGAGPGVRAAVLTTCVVVALAAGGVATQASKVQVPGVGAFPATPVCPA